MAIVTMADAVNGGIASATEYNKVTANIRDLDARLGAVDSVNTANSRLGVLESRTTDILTTGGIGNQRLADRLGTGVGTGTNVLTGSASSQLADVRSRISTLETAPAPISGPLGFVGEVKRISTDTVGATETIMENLPVNLQANRRYRVTWDFVYDAAVAGAPYPFLRIRISDVGVALTNTLLGNIVHSKNLVTTTVGTSVTMVNTFTVPISGAYQVGTSAVRSSNNVVIRYTAGQTLRCFLVEDMGPV